MRLTKEQVQGMFIESLKLFETHVTHVPTGIELKWRTLDDFKELLAFDGSTVPCFTTVLPSGKHPLRVALAIPFEIHACWAFLEAIIRPLNQKQTKVYLKSVFLQAIAQLMEAYLRDSTSSVWQECLSESGGVDSLAKELFIKRLPETILGKKATQVASEISTSSFLSC